VVSSHGSLQANYIGRTLWLRLHNAGPGAALDVQALIEELAPEQWDKAVISPGESAQIPF
jgi:hypothetical protein